MEVQKMPFPQNGSILHDQRRTVSNWYPIKQLAHKMDKATPASGQDLSYTIEPLTNADADEMIVFLKANFFKDEPLNKFINLGECAELEEYALKNVKDNCSFKAVSPSGEIIGVFVNGLMRRPAPGEPPHRAAANCKHPKFINVLRLMDAVDDRFNIFDLYPGVDTILDGKIVSVDNKYRGRGVANQLTQRTLEHMRQIDVPVMHVLCSSEFSARVVAKMGFHEVFSLPYAEFKVNGVQVFKPEHPHVGVRIFVKEIDLEPRSASAGAGTEAPTLH